ALPALRGRLGVPRSAFAAAATGIVALGASAMVLTSVRETTLFAQETTPPPTLETPAAPEPAPADPEATPAETAEPDSPAEPTPIQSAVLETGVDWPAYGGTHAALRYSPLEQITRDNVGELEEVWRFRTGDLPEGDEAFGNQNTPVKVGERLYICSALNKIFA